MEKYGTAGQAKGSIIRRMRLACRITRLQTHTLRTYKSTYCLFNGNNGYTNAPQCYVHTYTACLVIKCGMVSMSDWLRAGRPGDGIPVGARFSAPVQTGPGAHPASCKMGTGSFPGVKRGRGVTPTPHPF